MHKLEYKAELKQFVKKVKWENVDVVGSDYEETDDDLDTDELGDDLDEFDLEMYHEFYG